MSVLLLIPINHPFVMSQGDSPRLVRISSFCPLLKLWPEKKSELLIVQGGPDPSHRARGFQCGCSIAAVERGLRQRFSTGGSQPKNGTRLCRPPKWDRIFSCVCFCRINLIGDFMIRQKKVWVLRLHELRSAGLKCLKLQRLWNDKREARSLLDPTHFSLMMVVYCCLTANSKTSGQLFNPSASRWLSDGTLLIVFKLWNKWFFGGKRPICVHLDAGGSSLPDLEVIFSQKNI